MKVTIGIPVFNCEAWVATAIHSALEQTWPDKGIIVVDDGSTDRSAEICRSFGSRIRFVQQPNPGGNAARNLQAFFGGLDSISRRGRLPQTRQNPFPLGLVRIFLETPMFLCSSTIIETWKGGKVANQT